MGLSGHHGYQINSVLPLKSVNIVFKSTLTSHHLDLFNKVHTANIKECNLYKSDQCKFGPVRCWYRHGPAVENQTVNDAPQSQVFQPAPVPVIPPDLATQLSNLSLLINNLTTTLLPQGESNSSNRFHGR